MTVSDHVMELELELEKLTARNTELATKLAQTQGQLRTMEDMYTRECARADRYYRWTVRMSQLMDEFGNHLTRAHVEFDKEEKEGNGKMRDEMVKQLENSLVSKAADSSSVPAHASADRR